jgi:hypothetical protein
VEAEIEEAPKKRGRKPKTAVAKDDKAHLVLVKEKETYAAEVLAFVATFSIIDQDSANTIGALQAEAREIKEELQGLLKEKTKPLQDEEAQHRRDFKVAIDLASKVEEKCKEITAAHVRAVMKREEEARKAIEASGGQADPETLMVAHGGERVALAPTQSGRVVWNWREKTAAELEPGEEIPEKYFVRVLNTKMIAEEVKLLKDKTRIPGIVVEQDVTIVNSRRM